MRRRFNLSFFHILLFILIAGAVGYFFGTARVNISWKDYTPIANIYQKNPPPTQNLDMRLFYEVLEKVNKDFYDKTKIKSSEVLYGAISGMLKSLDDPYTSFFPPKQNNDFKTQLSGEFSGIGAELGLNKDDRIIIIAPLDLSPAQKAGLKAGDLILSVDGKDTFGWNLAEAVEKIRGPRGTEVKLAILHEGSKTPTNLTINRDTILIKSVKAFLKQYSCSKNTCKEEKGCSSCSTIAYIRLSQFGDKTNSEWVQAINSIYPQIQNSSNFKGIVLDVRNNPGGYLDDAVFITSEFLRRGVVVSQVNGEDEKNDMSVSRTGVLLDFPVMVLVNKGSASASEIVSGALRDHKRAKLVGETTFGKGTIQQAVDVDGGASVHISIGKWVTPNGIWVHEKGLRPDIEVKLDEKSIKENPNLDNQLQRAIAELLE